MESALLSDFSRVQLTVLFHGKGATYARLSLKREGKMARIAVDDDGAGISREALPRLFDGRNTRSPDDLGEDSRRTMGIGLSVCKTIITAHGGGMSAENRREGGARFSFTLPILEDYSNGDSIQDFNC